MDSDRGEEPILSPIPVFSSGVDSSCSGGEDTDSDYHGDDSDDAHYDGGYDSSADSVFEMITDDAFLVDFVKKKRMDELPESRKRKKARTLTDEKRTILDYNRSFGERCHYCRQTQVKDHVHCFTCSVKFCGPCLRNRNGENVRVEMRSNVRWICPKCRGGCGRGCSICCTCAPCRRSFKLEATGQVVRDARQIGFNNVHDYLIHLETGETAKEISRRKEGRGWTKDTGAYYNIEVETSRAWGRKRVRSARKRVVGNLRSKQVAETQSLGDDGHKKKSQCVVLEPGHNLRTESETQDSEDHNRHSQDRTIPARLNLDLNEIYDDSSEDAGEPGRDESCTSFLNERARVDERELQVDLSGCCGDDQKTEMAQTDGSISSCLDEKEATVPSSIDLNLNQGCSRMDERTEMPSKDGSCESFPDETEIGLPRYVLDLNRSCMDVDEKAEITHGRGSYTGSPDGKKDSAAGSKRKDDLDILLDNIKSSKRYGSETSFRSRSNSEEVLSRVKLTSRRSARKGRKLWVRRDSPQLYENILTPESNTVEDQATDLHEKEVTLQNDEKIPSSQPIDCGDAGKNKTKLSSFERGLEQLYLRPFSLKQLKEMWKHVTVCGPTICANQQDTNAAEAQAIDVAPGYLDLYPDLAQKLTKTFHPEDKLQVLRGFFFWLQHGDSEGSYRPWMTKQEGEDCDDFTSSTNSEAVHRLLAIDCDEGLESDMSDE